MPTPTSEPKLIAGNANQTLANAVSCRISMLRGQPIHLPDARHERFNHVEIYVAVYANVSAEDM